ncbi:class I SAM-dependent methyltransferase [Streptosporangium sp. NPDC023825]|uniref:SAM-dependent methyltransferase n=1 Tax=Streptosporangium sp. NPDC023825 TaxID=3154909 RepID=UPI00344829E3
MSHDISSTWYTNFFTELPNEFWRRAATPESTEADVDFVERHLGLRPRARILDVPCGSGRHTLALAARGHRLTGVDISAEAIGHARRAAADAGLDVDLGIADMRDIPRDGSFDAAVCMGNSFGYLEPEETREFVAALADAVRPGGGLVIDFNATAESVLPGYQGEPRQMRTGDITVTATTGYDVARSRLISGYRFTRGAEELEVTAIHHVYTSAHLGQILTDGGFTGVERFGGPDGSPFEIGAGRLLLTARRAEGPPPAGA